MKIASDNFIMTSIGFKTVFQLLQMQKNLTPLPKVLTFDISKSTDNLFFTEIGSIATHTDIDVYECFFMDSPCSKITTAYLSSDTSILMYDIKPTNIEPLVQRSSNVFSYLLNNKNDILYKWMELREFDNYGVLSPNVTFSDIVTKFLEKRILVRDNMYTILSPDTTGVDGNGDPITIPGTVIPIFVSRFLYNCNYILVK